MQATDIRRHIESAEKRIRPFLRETPVEPSPALSRYGAGRAWLKLENFQVTGSFKVRGALNALLSLPDEERRRGFVAASSGNHGAALAYAQGIAGCRGLIVVPEDASPAKVEAIRAQGAEVVAKGEDCVVSERWARKEAVRRGAVYVSPYNDPRIIAGQGTLALELDRQLNALGADLDAVYVAVGGGGLISGVASVLEERRPGVEIIGCSPENSAVMAASVRAGRLLDLPSKPTLSDGTAGGVEEGSITFELCRRLVDRFVLVTEEEIADAMRRVIGNHHLMIEGAAGVAAAAFLKDRDRNADRHAAIVLCGANLSLDVLRRVLA